MGRQAKLQLTQNNLLFHSDGERRTFFDFLELKSSTTED